MPPKLNALIYGAIALVLLFVIASTLILPFFASQYEHGFGDAPCNKDDTCVIGITNTSAGMRNPNCLTSTGTVTAGTNLNNSAGYASFLDNCYKLIAEPDGANTTRCMGCATFVGYRSTQQGLALLILVLGIISFALLFIRKIIR